MDLSIYSDLPFLLLSDGVILIESSLAIESKEKEMECKIVN